MTSNIKEKIGIRIRELRQAKGLKQCELADMLDMERSHLTRIESGKHRPSDENLAKIANILEVKISDLFDTDHIKTRNELITEINKLFPTLTDQEIKFCYKNIINLIQMRK